MTDITDSPAKTDPAVLRDRVARGVAWLDEQVPDWLDKVEVVRLHMASPCRCVLGQVFDEPGRGDILESGFAIGADLGERTTGYDDDLIDSHLTWADAYGFDSETNDDFTALQDIWESVIRARKALR